MFKRIVILMLAVVFLCVSTVGYAGEVLYKHDKQGNIIYPPYGLKNMTKTVEVEPGQINTCHIEKMTVKVQGIQFDDSHNVSLFWFRDKGGNRWVVPTGISEARFAQTEKEDVNEFIEVGKRYRVHIQQCGAGGRTKHLMDMYSLNTKKKGKKERK